MDRTITAIEKLKDIEFELLRLKNYAKLMNRSVEAKKEWVGLTDEEIHKIEQECDQKFEDYFEFANAIEAKLKEKNNG